MAEPVETELVETPLGETSVELVETPPRLAHALAALTRWRDRGVHFVGIRHHSPGCAAALAALLDEVRPAVVLIEGPREYDRLLPALADARTVPPVAVLSVGERQSAFYPLADFSPEWVALRWGMAAGATVRFFDASYSDDPDADEVRTLQAEHHLARSELIAAVAAANWAAATTTRSGSTCSRCAGPRRWPTGARSSPTPWRGPASLGSTPTGPCSTATARTPARR